MTTRDVISAFVDNEPFDPKDLLEALSASDGRELLIDFLALRHLTASDEVQKHPTPPLRHWWSGPRLMAAAALLTLALTGSYQLGTRATGVPDVPPSPTRVMTGDDIWRDIPRDSPDGGTR
jgi:hypothetical protein